MPAFAVLENGYLSVLLLLAGNMEYSSPMPILDYFWHENEHCFKKMAMKEQGSAKRAVNISKYS